MIAVINVIVMLRRRFSEPLFHFSETQRFSLHQTTATKRRQCNNAVFIIITQKRYRFQPMQETFMPFEKAMQAMHSVQAVQLG